MVLGVRWPVRLAVAIAVAVVAPRSAHAHVSASVDDNNRYLKLEPSADRIRLAYTIFYGEVPGAATRPSIDTNRDGSLDAAEASAFATNLASQVTDGLAVTLDGEPVHVEWAEVAAGMGAPSVAAGSFSIDLVAYFCFARVGGRHTFVMRDAVKLTRPGETEVHVVDATGIEVDHARIGPAQDASNDLRFAGAVPGLAEGGLDLAFTAGPAALDTHEPRCADAHHAPVPMALIVALAAGLAVVVTTIVVLRKRS